MDASKIYTQTFPGGNVVTIGHKHRTGYTWSELSRAVAMLRALGKQMPTETATKYLQQTLTAVRDRFAYIDGLRISTPEHAVSYARGLHATTLSYTYDVTSCALFWWATTTHDAKYAFGCVYPLPEAEEGES